MAIITAILQGNTLKIPAVEHAYVVDLCDSCLTKVESSQRATTRSLKIKDGDDAVFVLVAVDLEGE